MRATRCPTWMARCAVIVSLIASIGHASAQNIVATPEQRLAIEAQINFFRTESDAVLTAAGVARTADAEDCILQATIQSTTYVCPVPPDARDRIKSALAARQWTSATVPTRDPWYALDAFSKGASFAYFVCAPRVNGCLFEIQQPN